MLPDFPDSRKKLSELEHRQIRLGVAAHLGIFASIGYRFVREGGASTLVRDDGQVDNLEMRSLAVDLSIPVNEAEQWTRQDRAKHLSEIARSMAEQQVKLVVDKMDVVTQSTGNVVNAKGKKPEEVIFEMLSKIQIEFDSNGAPEFPQLTGGEGVESLSAGYEKIFSTPELLKRFNDILILKKEEWREREADRTLVG